MLSRTHRSKTMSPNTENHLMFKRRKTGCKKTRLWASNRWQTPCSINHSRGSHIQMKTWSIIQQSNQSTRWEHRLMCEMLQQKFKTKSTKKWKVITRSMSLLYLSVLVLNPCFWQSHHTISKAEALRRGIEASDQRVSWWATQLSRVWHLPCPTAHMKTKWCHELSWFPTTTSQRCSYQELNWALKSRRLGAARVH